MPENQPAAARLERVEVRVRRVQKRGRARGVLLVIRELVARVVPRRIVEHEVLEHLGAERESRARRRLAGQRRGAADDPLRPSVHRFTFAPERLRRRDRAVLVPRLGVDRLERGPLRLGEARQRSDVHLAPARIVDQPVLHAVERVALRDDLRFHRLECVHRKQPRAKVPRIRKHRLHVLDELRADRREVVRGRAGDDAVEIVRIALRFHHRLPSAVRAAGEVRLCFVRAVVAADDRLGDFRRAMHCEVAEIHLALEIVQRPRRVGDPALMAGIGADRRVAGVYRPAGLILDLTDEPAAAAHHELPVPFVGQEEREMDLAADDAVHAAVCDANAAGGGRGHGGRLRHLHVGQLQHGEVRALGVIGGGGLSAVRRA